MHLYVGAALWPSRAIDPKKEKEEFEMICAEEGADEVSAFPFAFQFAAAQLKPAGG